MGLLTAGIVAAGCSCEGAGGPDDAGVDTRSADLLAVDAGPVDAPPVHDSAIADSHDTLPPLPDGLCGTRTLSPKVITPYAGKPCGKGCKQVTFGNFVELHYDVVGDQLVYIGQRGTGYKVYLVDLKSGTEYQLHQDWPKKFQGCSLVHTDGKTPAYTCVRGDYPDAKVWLRSVTTYDPATKVETDLYCYVRKRSDNVCFPYYISTGTTGIGLNDSLTACKYQDMLFYRFSDGSFTNISKAYGGVFQGHMSGHVLVWTQVKTGWPSTQIVAYDTTSNTQWRVDPASGSQYLPRIEGDQVVWTDHRNAPGDMWAPGNSDIYYANLKTAKTMAVTTHEAKQERPDVWGDWVVWQDWRSASASVKKNIDIYVKNIKTGKVYPIATTSATEAYPRIDNDRVFYTMPDSKGEISLFMVDLKTRLAP